MQKKSLTFFLEVSLVSQYTLSVEMFFDRFGQSNKFSKKILKFFWDIQVWRSSTRRAKNAMGIFRINLPGTSLECQIRTSLGRHLRASDWDVRLDPWDVLGTNICSWECQWWISHIWYRIILILSGPFVLLPFLNYFAIPKSYFSLIKYKIATYLIE